MIARHKYQILFWLCIAATITASLMPGGGKPLFQMQDKVFHAAIYALLFFFLCARLQQSISTLACWRWCWHALV